MYVKYQLYLRFHHRPFFKKKNELKGWVVLASEKEAYRLFLLLFFWKFLCGSYREICICFLWTYRNLLIDKFKKIRDQVANLSMSTNCKKVEMFLGHRFCYYTAGSGGAGPTILATSFLLLGEEAIAYNRGYFYSKLTFLLQLKLLVWFFSNI